MEEAKSFTFQLENQGDADTVEKTATTLKKYQFVRNFLHNMIVHPGAPPVLIRAAEVVYVALTTIMMSISGDLLALANVNPSSVDDNE